MKISVKIVLLLAVLIFFFTAVEYGVLSWQIDDYHRDIEKEYVERNLSRCTAAVLRTADDLREMASKWAATSAVKESMRLSHVDPVRFSLDQRRFQDSGFDLFALANTDGSVILSRAYGLDHGDAPLEFRYFRENTPLPASLMSLIGQSNVDTAGLVDTEHGPLMLNVTRVLEDDGLPLGSIVLGRVLSKKMISAIALRQQEGINLYPYLPEQDIQIGDRPVVDRHRGMSPQIEYDSETTVSAHSILADIFGRSAFVIRVTSKRMFLGQEKNTLLIALLTNTAVGLLIAFFVMALLKKWVISRINQLVEQVSSIRATGDFDSRIKISGQDEVGLLATSFNHALARLKDMARRKEESEKRYATLVEQSKDGVLILTNGDAKFVNRRLIEMLGCDDEKEILESPLGFISPAVRSDLKSRIEKQRGDGERAETVQSRLVSKKGEELEAEIDVVSATYENEDATFLYIRDVSEEKRLERHLQRVDKLTSLGQLSAGIAHEIRTPLGSIQLNLENLLHNASIDTDQRHLLENSMMSVNRISDIVQRTLDFAKPAEPSFTSTQVADVLDNVLQIMSTNLRKNGVEVVREFGQDLPVFEGDSVQLGQAFVNIVLNAMQAMPSGGTLRIWTKCTEEKGCAALEVGFADTGIGIADESLKKVFDPFFTSKHDGVGLGLSIVHRILEQHRATVDIESTPGRGTTLIIRFPLNNVK